MREAIAPLRWNLLSILRDLLGAHVTKDDLILCEMSVVGRCRTVTDLKRRPPGIAGLKRLSERSIEELADHITEFSLVGVQAIRQRADANARRCQSCRLAKIPSGPSSGVPVPRSGHAGTTVEVRLRRACQRPPNHRLAARCQYPAANACPESAKFFRPLGSLGALVADWTWGAD